MGRFRIRDILSLTTIVALLLGWALDHANMVREVRDTHEMFSRSRDIAEYRSETRDGATFAHLSRQLDEARAREAEAVSALARAKAAQSKK